MLKKQLNIGLILDLAIVLTLAFIFVQAGSMTKATHVERNGNIPAFTNTITEYGLNCEDNTNGAEDCEGRIVGPSTVDHQMFFGRFYGYAVQHGGDAQSARIDVCLTQFGQAWSGLCSTDQAEIGQGATEQLNVERRENNPNNTTDYNDIWWHIRVNEARFDGRVEAQSRRVWQELNTTRTDAVPGQQFTVNWETENAHETLLMWDGPISSASGLSDGGGVNRPNGSGTFNVTGGPGTAYLTLVSYGPGHNGQTRLEHDVEVNIGPPPSPGTITVTTNRNDGCWNMYQGPSENIYGPERCGRNYQYSGAPNDQYRIRPEAIAGMEFRVEPNVVQTLNSNSISFHIEYYTPGGGGPTPPPGPTYGTLAATATLNGAATSTQIIVNYSYNGVVTNNAPFSLPYTTPAYTGQYCVQYVSGGPAGATYTGVTAPICQSLTQGSTFSMNFPFLRTESYGIGYQVTYALLPLNAPVISAMANPGCNQVQVDWTYVPNTREQWFTVERATSASGPWTTLSGNLLPGIRTFTDNTAEAATPYYYRVKAHSAIGVPGGADTPSAISGPYSIPACVADLLFDMAVSHVNGAPRTASTRISDGDVLRIQMTIRNAAVYPGTVTHICVGATSNMTNYANLTSSRGTNGGITGAAGNCVTRRLNVSGQQTSVNPSWIVTYETTATAMGDEAEEILRTTGTLWFSDPSGSHSRSQTLTLLMQEAQGESGVPDFNEVGN